VKNPAPLHPYRGAVLIVILVLLALLSLLAVSLATTSVLDKNVSYNYLDCVRARLVAKAGVERSMAEIMSMIGRGRFDDRSMTYWGAKTDERGEPDFDTPLSRAANPSFAVENEDVQNPDDDKVTPAKFQLEDREVGISGTMTSCTYGIRSDVFRLRVADANSRLYINDGMEDANVAKNLKRILNNLGAVCKLRASNVGDKLIDRRPKNGYRSRKELEEVLGHEDYQKLAPNISLYAWVDPDVVNPVPLSQTVLGAYPVDYNHKISLYRYGRSRDASNNLIQDPLVFAPDYARGEGFTHAIVALDEINAQWISRSARAPVNVNSASKELITALIAELRGFFVAERRKHNPGAGEYSFLWYVPSENRPDPPAGDEYGFLYATPAFIGPMDRGSSAAQGMGGGIEAGRIAEEIIQCRTGGRSKESDSYDYGAVWFGGPFRSWRQFNAFCDNLVLRGILRDGRQIYFDYSPDDGAGGSWYGGDPAGSDTRVASASQARVGAQAMADVLKANFNPNCTLNELNPDRNLFLEVDKTDLICHSTEFCFNPMGYFEIESEGLVIQPPHENDDFMKVRKGVVRAREMMEAAIKVYDVYRESRQAEFYKGDKGPTLRRRLTNSNCALETGPEPDSDDGAALCNYSGWIQLSTIGGIPRRRVSGPRPTTPADESILGTRAFAHYQFDHRLNYHASNFNEPLRYSSGYANKADRTEREAGPYNPSKGRKGQYRLCHDYPSDHLPTEPEYNAVSDLRIDGAYVERDSSILYQCTANTFSTIGTVAMWIKPSYKPEMTGKPRTYFSTDTSSGTYQLINGLWFFASHDARAYEASPNENSFPVYANGPWRPICFCAGFATKGGAGGGVGTMTPSLNHRTHADTENKDMIRHHEWVHVAYRWNMASGGQSVEIKVNGETPPGMGDIYVHPGDSDASDWTQEGAIFRIGEPSAAMGPRNWSADATVDEFYLWGHDALQGEPSTVKQLYEMGRYHVPRFGLEGVFTSHPILENVTRGRRLADPTAIRPPLRREPGDKNRTQTAAPAPASVDTDQRQVLSAFWTWYPEAVDVKGKPIAYDHFTENWASPPSETKVEVKLIFMIDGNEVGEYMSDDGGTPVTGVAVKKGEVLQYRMKVSMPNANGGTILRATPIIDDVTFFHSEGVDIIYYNREEWKP